MRGGAAERADIDKEWMEMHATLQELLKTPGVPVLLDGAWGTQLQKRGLPVGACPERWNLEHPDLVADVARAYVEAGSRIILTNTFGGNRFILEAHGLGEQVAEINRRGVELSCRAAGNAARVFASMGPSGRMLMMEEVSAAALGDAFSEQARALAAGGAAGLVVETMTDLDEAEIAVRAAAATGLPVVACMVYGGEGDRYHTMMGVTPAQQVERLEAAGAQVIGANCGDGVNRYIGLCRILRGLTARPLWMKPNAGLPEMVDGRATYRTTPEEFAAQSRLLRDAGANFIGGCCGTNPDFIGACGRAWAS